MKKYDNPMLQVVSINKNDVIATSITNVTTEYNSTWETLAPGRSRDWDAGY